MVQPGQVFQPDPSGTGQDNNNDQAQDQTIGGTMPPVSNDDQSTPPVGDDQPADSTMPPADVPADTPADQPATGMPPAPSEPAAEPTDAPAEPSSEPEAESSEPAVPEPAADAGASPPDTTPPADPAGPGDENQNQTVATATVSGSNVSWQASEFVSHNRPLVWYVGLGAISLGLVALSVLVLKEWLSAAVVVLMAVSLVVYAHRPPRTLQYAVTQIGLQVGDKAFSYGAFKSFAVIAMRDYLAIEFDPVKRFSPRLTIFLDPNQAEAIANELGRHLAREDRQADFIDKLAHSLKF